MQYTIQCTINLGTSAVHHLFYLKIRIQVIEVKYNAVSKCVMYLWETILHERDPKSPSFALRIIVFRIFMKTNTLGRVRNIWTTSRYTSIGHFLSENCGIDANRTCKLLQTRGTPATSLDPIFREVIHTAKI